MPWKRMDVEEQRLQLAVQAVSGKQCMAALCGGLRHGSLPERAE
jgi:hypothetical protein